MVTISAGDWFPLLFSFCSQWERTANCVAGSGGLWPSAGGRAFHGLNDSEPLLCSGLRLFVDLVVCCRVDRWWSQDTARTRGMSHWRDSSGHLRARLPSRQNLSGGERRERGDGTGFAWWRIPGLPGGKDGTSAGRAGSQARRTRGGWAS